MEVEIKGTVTQWDVTRNGVE